MALISGIAEKVIDDSVIAFGEIGLSGEVRAVSHIDYRVKEAVRLGFTKIILPSFQAFPQKLCAYIRPL
jgi:DNA repair protein RadA/Sms